MTNLESIRNRVGLVARRRCLVLLLSLAPCAAAPAMAAVAGYEARGCITYTILDSSAKPSGKKVMLFRVQVRGNSWRIRTEPAIRSARGIAFNDVSPVPPDSVVMVTAFRPIPGYGDQYMDALRAEVRVLKRDDIGFSNPPVRIPPEIARLLAPAPRPDTGGGPTLSGRPATNRASILAEADVFPGSVPPADGTYASLLRFAFVPAADEGTNTSLPQVWDDGHPRTVRFRHARWERLKAAPGLIASAAFDWGGKELAAGGALVDIQSSQPGAQPGVEARYQVETVTNVQA